MSEIPEQDPISQEPFAASLESPVAAEEALSAVYGQFPAAIEEPSPSEAVQAVAGLDFRLMPRPEPRIPHLGHLVFLLLLASIGLLATSVLTQAALHFRLFGVSNIKQALTDIHYTLGSMAVLYLITLAAAVLIFPLFWHKSFFEGIQWRASTALGLRKRLFSAAVLCFVLALINGWLLPGPSNTPIDKLFRTPAAAWMMFAFGITFAPFFEEIVFRGFLLPALCTAFDWMGERFHRQPAPPLDANGHPEWSMVSMAIASVVTSIPFALMHAEQTSYALGPFLLLVCVSLVLCWTRLATRSLAASVMVHACYNFLLFTLMFFGTSGFRHLDKM